MVSLGGEVEAGGCGKAEVGFQEEEVEMGNREAMEVVVGQPR